MQLYAFECPSCHFPSITCQSKFRSRNPAYSQITWKRAIGFLFVLFVLSLGARAQTAPSRLEQQALSAFNPAAKTFSSMTLSGATT
jgi:hypothetical protein